PTFTSVLTNNWPEARVFQSVNSVGAGRLLSSPVEADDGDRMSSAPALATPVNGLASPRESRTAILVISTPVSRRNCSFTRDPMGMSTSIANEGRWLSGKAIARTNAPSMRPSALAPREYASTPANPSHPIQDGIVDGAATCVQGPAVVRDWPVVALSRTA